MQWLLPGSSGVWACDSRRCPLTQLLVPHSLLCPDTSYCLAAETPATSDHWLFHWVTILPDLVASDNNHHFICAKSCRSGSRAGFRWVVLLHAGLVGWDLWGWHWRTWPCGGWCLGLAGSLSLSPHGSLYVFMEGGRGAQHFHSPVLETTLLHSHGQSLSKASWDAKGRTHIYPLMEGWHPPTEEEQRGCWSLLWKQNLPPRSPRWLPLWMASN